LEVPPKRPIAFAWPKTEWRMAPQQQKENRKMGIVKENLDLSLMPVSRPYLRTILRQTDAGSGNDPEPSVCLNK
jgi:hypothetical protein